MTVRPLVVVLLALSALACLAAPASANESDIDRGRDEIDKAGALVTTVLDTEFDFARLRNDIRDGRSLNTVRGDVADVRAGLVDSDRVLASKGVVAPAIAFGFAFSIIFREGVEAVLLIAILLGSLAAGSAQNYKRPL